MENLLSKITSQKLIQLKIESVYQTLFSQESEERLYFEIEKDKAYIVDTGNNDVRTEGMSYGMMIALQLNKPKIFDKLWKWVKTYMASPKGSENEGYFIWSCSISGEPNDDGPAPDGEEFFAASLLLAEKRWGIKEYGEEARRLLSTMVHKGENASKGNPMFDPERTYIRFVPSRKITDPSYHLPHFYHVFANDGNVTDRSFFLKAERQSRKFLLKSADKKTGMTPEYSDFEGTPYNLDGHWTFFSDSYRTAANIGLDWAWIKEDVGQRQIALNIQRFFEPYLEGKVTKIPTFKISGSPLTKEDQNKDHFPPLTVHHPIGLWSTLAQAGSVAKFSDKSILV